VRDAACRVVARRVDASAGTEDRRMDIRDFQALIRERYYETDRERGVPKTFLWLTEEIGELAHALAQREKGKEDRANLEEEFADVLAWLTTIANVCEIDLEQAIRRKYLDDGGPKGTK
jgi:NTP pyrophosphatase (non-canonical NTP hydrolase)